MLSFTNKNWRRKCFFLCLYRSPSQGRGEFESFCTDFNLFLSNINYLSPSCSIITGDFNARSTEWWKLDKESFERRKNKHNNLCDRV